eukprot:COSAG01_NODE_3175_length_6465_cov_2.887527_2_plen_106_part_00
MSAIHSKVKIICGGSPSKPKAKYGSNSEESEFKRKETINDLDKTVTMFLAHKKELQGIDYTKLDFSLDQKKMIVNLVLCIAFNPQNQDALSGFLYKKALETDAWL